MEKPSDIYVLTANRKEGNLESWYTDICGVTFDEKVAEAWAAGQEHYATLVQIGELNVEGYEKTYFEDEDEDDKKDDE